MKSSYQQQKIREELEAHLNDLTAELIAAGRDPDMARREAEKMFGNRELIVGQIIAEEHVGWWNRYHPIVPITFFHLFLAVGIFVTSRLMPSSVEGTFFEPLFLWWTYVGLIGAALIVMRWIMEYTGLRGSAALWLNLAFIAVTTFSLTFIYDIDRFELLVDIFLLGAVLGATSRFWWRLIDARFRRWVVLVYGLISLVSTLLQKPIFFFLKQKQCYYVTPDLVDQGLEAMQCHQVNLLSSVFGLIVVISPIALFGFLGFVFLYARDRSVAAHRKIGLLVVTGLLLFTPLFLQDIDNYGAISVLPWKTEIYKAYEEILGRRPEPKDIEFYAATRSYVHMGEIKDVLYASRERRLKINLIFEEALKRPATETEIEQYVRNRWSVEDIYRQLNFDLWRRKYGHSLN